MSLFPAFDASSSQNVRETEPSASNKDSWLTNFSFAPDLSKTLTRLSDDNCILVDSDVEEVVVYDKQKKQHRKKHKKVKKHKEKSRSPPPLPKPKSIFVSKQPGASKDVYFLDVKKDLENLQFDSTYKRQQSKYRMRTFNCLAATTKINEAILDDQFKLSKKLKSDWRYFGRKSNLPKEPKPMQNFKGVLSKLDQDFIQLKNENMIVDNEEFIFDPKVQMYRPAKDMEEESLTLKLQDQPNTQFNKMLAKDPSNIELWLKFIDYQDSLYNKTGSEKASVIDRKLAILDKAIDSNPKSVELKLLKIDLGFQSGWDIQKMNESWKNLEFHHVNSLTMWRKRLATNYFHFRHFTTGRNMQIVLNCLEKLNLVLKGKLVTHQPELGTEKFIVEVLVYAVDFWLQSGNSEKALALCQALLEFNFCQPKVVNNLDDVEKRKFFEPFWSAGIRRIGENGSTGWASFVDNTSLKSEVDTLKSASNFLDQLESEVLIDLTKNEQNCWLKIEQSRSNIDWIPFNQNQSEPPEDFERMVLFDDIEKLLYSIDNEENQFWLIFGLLESIGLNLPEFKSERIVNLTDYCKKAEELFDCLPINRENRFHGFDQFYSTLIQCLIDRFEKLWIKLFLNCSLLYNESRRLNRIVNITTKNKIRQYRTYAKSILAQPDCRSSLLLYTSYSEGLEYLKDFELSIDVVKLALENHFTTKSFYDLDDTGKYVSLYSLDFYLSLNLGCCKDGQNLTGVIPTICQFFGSAKSGSFNVLRCKRNLEELFSDLVVKRGISNAEKNWLECWLGSEFLLVTKIYTIFNMVISTTGSLDKWSQILVEAKSVLDQESNLNPELERLWEWEIQLLQYQLKTTVTISHRILSERLNLALEKFPSNPFFLKAFVEMNVSGHLTMKLRQFLNKKYFGLAQNKLSIRQLARIYAEFKIFVKFRDEDAFNSYDCRCLKSSLEQSVELCRSNSTLWCLYLKMASMISSSLPNDKEKDSFIQQIFYRSIRECPAVKQLYMEGISILKNDQLRKIIDLMTEKEVRLRLPWEEFELLWRNARKCVPLEEKNEDYPESDETE